MTSFTVEWGDDDLDDLTSIWLNASDRNAVTKAEAEVNRLLKQNPLGIGENLSEGLRRIVVAPLIVYYTVDSENLVVEVEGVGYLQ